MPDKLKDFGYVYLIMAPDVGAMKVGKSRSPVDRLRAMQTGSPASLILAGMSFMHDVTKAEAYLHRKLRRYHLHGEWFRARPMVVAWLRDLLSIGYGAPACACRRCRKLWV